MTQTCPIPARRRRAFTLVELIAVMVVLGTLATVTVGIVRQLAEAQNATATRSQMLAEASMAMDRMVNLIKFTPVRTTAAQTPAISAIGVSSITWENGDTLSLSGTTLNLCSVRDGDTPGNPRPLLTNVSAITFTPRNDNEISLFTTHGTSSLNAAQSGETHSMDISLTMARGQATARLTTRVFLRANAELTGP